MNEYENEILYYARHNCRGEVRDLLILESTDELDRIHKAARIVQEECEQEHLRRKKRDGETRMATRLLAGTTE